MSIDRPTVRNVVIALATGAFVVALASVGRSVNGWLVTVIGDNMLTRINLAVSTFLVDNAIPTFLAVAAVAFALGVVENRRDRERP